MLALVNQEGGHPNVLKSYGVIMRPTTPGQSGTMGIITEECIESLFHFQRETYIEAPTVMHILASISRGMAHIHSLGLVHLDLKPENIFLGEDCNLKVCFI
jgi:serine/threonine protein kinase